MHVNGLAGILNDAAQGAGVQPVKSEFASGVAVKVTEAPAR